MTLREATSRRCRLHTTSTFSGVGLARGRCFTPVRRGLCHCAGLGVGMGRRAVTHTLNRETGLTSAHDLLHVFHNVLDSIIAQMCHDLSVSSLKRISAVRVSIIAQLYVFCAVLVSSHVCPCSTPCAFELSLSRTRCNSIIAHVHVFCTVQIPLFLFHGSLSLTRTCLLQVPRAERGVHQDGGPGSSRLLLRSPHQPHLSQTRRQGMSTTAVLSLRTTWF